MRRIQRTLYETLRLLDDRALAPSAVVIDSQSVKTAKAGGPRGYDGGKKVKGRKRHIVTDTLGYMVDVAVTTANTHDTKGGQKALKKAVSWLEKKPKIAFADKGYQGAPFAKWVEKNVGATVHVSGNPAYQAKQFVPMKKRWVVERTFAWMSDYRRLDKDHERKMGHSVGMIRWAMVLFSLRRLTA